MPERLGAGAGVVGGGGRGGMLHLILHLISFKTGLFRFRERKGEAETSLMYCQDLKYGLPTHP